VCGGEPKLSCHRRSRAALASQELDASNIGRQDHTTSPYAFVTLVSRNISVHRDPPTFVTMANAPEQDGTAKDLPLICPSGKAKYFLFRGLTQLLKIQKQFATGFAKAAPGAAVGFFVAPQVLACAQNGCAPRVDGTSSAATVAR